MSKVNCLGPLLAKIGMSMIISLPISLLIWLVGGIAGAIFATLTIIFEAFFVRRLFPHAYGLLLGALEGFKDFPPVFTYSGYAAMISYPLCVVCVIFISVRLSMENSSKSVRIRRRSFHNNVAERNAEQVRQIRVNREARKDKEELVSRWLPK